MLWFISPSSPENIVPIIQINIKLKHEEKIKNTRLGSKAATVSVEFKGISPH